MAQKVKDVFINKISENQICNDSRYSFAWVSIILLHWFGLKPTAKHEKLLICQLISEFFFLKESESISFPWR